MRIFLRAAPSRSYGPPAAWAKRLIRAGVPDQVRCRPSLCSGLSFYELSERRLARQKTGAVWIVRSSGDGRALRYSKAPRQPARTSPFHVRRDKAALSSGCKPHPAPSRQRRPRRCPTGSSNWLRLDGKRDHGYGGFRTSGRLVPRLTRAQTAMKAGL
jgi:hypothetical protein